MSQKVWDLILLLDSELTANPKIKISKMTIPLPLNKRDKAQISGINPQGIWEFHKEMNGLYIEWSAKRVKDANVQGLVKIMSIQEILKDWQGIIFFEFTEENDRIRKFHPIDFFIDEACVGAFINEADKEDCSLYLYSFGDDPINLSLNMMGYIQMLLSSRGFLYWQYAILEIISGQENPSSQRFKKWMPKLFTGFEWEQFVSLYNSLKVSRV